MKQAIIDHLKEATDLRDLLYFIHEHLNPLTVDPLGPAPQVQLEALFERSLPRHRQEGHDYRATIMFAMAAHLVVYFRPRHSFRLSRLGQAALAEHEDSRSLERLIEGRLQSPQAAPTA